MNLDAYLRRLDYSGPLEPTRATLDALCLAHVRAVPFENLDILLGRNIELDDDAVERKIVGDRRGGYCFELNTLFSRLLTRLGFEVELLSARVRVQLTRDVTPPRTHCFVRVMLDGTPLLADVGVGGASLACSVRLDTEAEQRTPHEPRRLVRDGALVFHQVRHGDEWTDVWESTLEPMPSIDREVANWYTSTHPRSKFRTRLSVARVLEPGVRATLRDRDFTLRSPSGAETRRVATPDELLEVLSTHFALEFPKGTRFIGPAFEWD